MSVRRQAFSKELRRFNFLHMLLSLLFTIRPITQTRTYLIVVISQLNGRRVV